VRTRASRIVLDMAARRRTATRSTRAGSEIVVVNAGPPARRSSGGSIAPRRRRRSKGRRKSGGGGGGSKSLQSRLQSVALGGLAYGLAIKHIPQLPRIPGIGRSGTVALAMYFLKPSSQLLQDIGIAAAAIAGASFGENGSVSGEDDVLSSD
jgi:hypothetical protein